MQRFVAEVELHFEAESLETAGRSLHALSEAVAAAGFELKRGKVAPARADEDASGGTSYAPLDG